MGETCANVQTRKRQLSAQRRRTYELHSMWAQCATLVLQCTSSTASVIGKVLLQ
jgi:hypothetical protein